MDRYYGSGDAYNVPKYPGVAFDDQPETINRFSSAWKSFTESDEITGATSGVRGILKGGFKTLDDLTNPEFYKSTAKGFGRGLTGGYAEMSLGQVTDDKRVIETIRQELDSTGEAEGDTYGIQPSLLSKGIGAFERGVSTFITRPLSTGFMLTDPNNPYRGGGDFVKDTWNRSERVPFSRAMVANELNEYIPDSVNPTGAITKALGLTEYDVYDDASMAAADNNPMYNFITGVVQVGTEFVPLGGMKPIKAAAQYLGYQRKFTGAADFDEVRENYERHKAWLQKKEAKDEVTDDAADNNTRFDSPVVLDDEVRPAQTPVGINIFNIAESTDVIEIARNPLVKEMVGVDQSRLVSVLSRANDPDTVFEIYMALKNDLIALTRLQDSSPDVVWFLGEGDAWRTQRLVNGEPYRPVGEELDRVKQTFASSSEYDDFWQDVRSLMTGRTADDYVPYRTAGAGGTRMPTVRGGRFVGGVAPLATRVRGAMGEWVYKWNTKGLDEEDFITATSVPRVPGGPVTRLVHWAGKRVPKGRVSMSTARPNDWLEEFDATYGSVPILSPGYEEALSVRVVDGQVEYMSGAQYVAQAKARLIQAQSDRNFYAVYRQVEQETVYAIALTLTKNPQRAQEIVDELVRATDEVTEAESYIQTSKGLLVEQEGPAILYSPETLSMMAESFETVDLRKVFDLVKRNDALDKGKRKAAAAGQTVDTGINIFDGVTAFFRTNVLLRPGYIPKNSVTEPAIASLITHGTVLTTEGLLETARNFAKNRVGNTQNLLYRADIGARMKSLGASDALTEGALEARYDQLVAEYRMQQTSLDEAIADLEAVKNGDIPPGRSAEVQERATRQLAEAAVEVKKIEDILSEVNGQFDPVNKPLTLAQLNGQIGELEAIIEGNFTYPAALIREANDMRRRAAAQSNRLLSDIDDRINASINEAEEAARQLDVESGYLDEVSVAASDESYTIVTYMDGSRRFLRGDRRELFSYNYRVPEVDRAGRQAPDRDTGKPFLESDEIWPDLQDSPTSVGLNFGERLANMVRSLKVTADADDTITVYRDGPPNSPMQPGQFVTPFKDSLDVPEGFVVYQMDVRLGDLYNDGTDITRWGWSPKYQQDIREVEYLSGNPDGPTVRAAVNRDRRGSQAFARMEYATKRLAELREERAKMLEKGLGALDNSVMPGPDRRRLEVIEETLERIRSLGPEDQRLAIRPNVERTLDDDTLVWNEVDFPGVFNLDEQIDQLRVADAFAGDIDYQYIRNLDSGAGEGSLQDIVRDWWRDQARRGGPDRDEFQFDPVEPYGYQVDDMLEAVGESELDNIYENYDSLLEDVRNLRSELGEGAFEGTDLTAESISRRLYEPLDYMYSQGLSRESFTVPRVFMDKELEEFGEFMRLWNLGDVDDRLGIGGRLVQVQNFLEGFLQTRTWRNLLDNDHARDTMGRPWNMDEYRQVVALTAYVDAQRSLERMGYGPDDLVEVWRTGDESSNANGVVALTLVEGGLRDFNGEVIKYVVPRSRVLYDARSLTENMPRGLRADSFTAAEQELGAHFNDLQPVGGYKPVLRQSPYDENELTDYGWDFKFTWRAHENAAITLDASNFQRSQVLRSEKTGRIEGIFGSAPEPSGTIHLLPAREAYEVVTDLQVFASAKFEDSVADVVSLVQDLYPNDMAKLAEDALHMTKASADYAYRSGDIGPWIDEYFKTFWQLRQQREVKNNVPEPSRIPDIGPGYSDPNSMWWGIDQGEIGLVKVNDNGVNLVSDNPTPIGSHPNSLMGDRLVTDYVAFGDLSPNRGIRKKKKATSNEAKLTALLERLRTIRDEVSEDAVRPGQSPAEAIEKHTEALEELRDKIAEVEGKLAAKQVKKEEASRYHGTGQGPLTLNVGGRALTIPGFRSEQPGMRGELWATASSADETARLTVDPSSRGRAAVGRYRDNGQLKVIDRYDQMYWPELAYVGNLFREDPLLRRILTEPKASVIAWLKTPEGKDYAAAIGKDYLVMDRKSVKAPKRGGSAETPLGSVPVDQGTVDVIVSEARHIDDLYDIVYSYFPNQSVRARIAGGDTKVGTAELRGMLSQEKELANIASGVREYTDDNIMGGLARRALDRLWKWAQSDPETRISRWPFMNRQFKRNMESAANVLESQGIKMTTEQAEVMRTAQLRYALDEMDKTYYNIRRYNQGAYTARFLTSFPGAFFNSMYRYGRFAVKYPDQTAITALAMGDILRVFGTGPDGEPTTEKTIGETTWLNFPANKEEVILLVSGKDDWKEMDGGFRFPVQSLATLFIDYPGPSWLVSMTMNQLAKMFPGFDEGTQQIMGPMYEEYFPFGPERDIVEGLLGAYQKDIKRAVEGPSNEDYALTAIQFHANNMAVWERNLDALPDAPAPRLQDAIDDAYAFHTARGVKKAFAPVTISEQVPGDYMRQAWYEFKELNPGDTAVDREAFMNRFGDWARWYTYSASSYTAYLPASQDAYRLIWRDHPDLVKSIVADASSDEVIGVISLLTTGVDETFSTAVNNYYKNNPLPGDKEPLSKRMTVAQFQNRVDIADGWDMYSRNRVKYDAEIENFRELRDTADTAERREFYRGKVQESENNWQNWMLNGPLSKNDAWQIDKSTNTNKRVLANSVLGTITEDKKFMSTTGDTIFWKMVKDFLKTEREALAAYRKLSDKSKAEYRARFRTWVRSEVVPQAPEFGPIFERYYGAQWDPNEESLNDLVSGGLQ